MIVDLVQTTTCDGVRLDGMLQVPPAGRATQLPADAFLFIHGTGGSFYSSTLFDSFGERLLDRGSAVLRVNTRGHDGISTAATARGGQRLGAAYELVDDCRYDLAAWTDWLGTRGFSRIGLVGHSLGAVKSMYWLAVEPHAAVVCLVALSPPRLSYSHFAASDRGPEFLAACAVAEQHVRAGQPLALMEVTLPLPFVIAAGGYLEKYGPDERYNFLKFASRLPVPTLFTYGSVELETNMAFRGVPELLAPIVAAHGRMQVEVIAGADHFYSGVRAEAVSRVEAWLRGESWLTAPAPVPRGG